MNAPVADGLLTSAGPLAAAVDGIVMNGMDVAKMRLLKDTQGNYTWASPDSAIGTAAIWSVPLVTSPSMAAGTWLTGAFRQSTTLFERQLDY